MSRFFNHHWSSFIGIRNTVNSCDIYCFSPKNIATVATFQWRGRTLHCWHEEQEVGWQSLFYWRFMRKLKKQFFVVDTDGLQSRIADIVSRAPPQSPSRITFFERSRLNCSCKRSLYFQRRAVRVGSNETREKMLLSNVWQHWRIVEQQYLFRCNTCILRDSMSSAEQHTSVRRLPNQNCSPWRLVSLRQASNLLPTSFRSTKMTKMEARGTEDTTESAAN